ncbi:MAG: DUF362 domain-containing protein [Chloroflexota bacterium]
MSKLTRRQMLQLLALASGGAGLGWLTQRSQDLQALAQAQESSVYLPLVKNGEPITTPEPGSLAGRVVHTHTLHATDWNGTTMFYEHVNQTAVNSLFQAGLREFTGKNTDAEGWDMLFRRVRSGGYVAGQTKIAVKINANNSAHEPGNTCTTHDNSIDALPQVAIALMRSLVTAGVEPGDVTFYDASGKLGSYSGKPIPPYFLNAVRTAYPDVKFVGQGSCANTLPTTYGTRNASTQTVTFSTPNPDPNPYERLQNRLLADVLYDAAFLINMPIIKVHGGDGAIPVSLSMKNHFGSINYVYDSPGYNNLHEYLELDNASGYYTSTYSPLVELNSHPQIKNKTVLIVADALFGGKDSSSSPVRSWKILYGPANSLLFATDPVAIDCVMTDLLRLEAQQTGTELYLKLNDPHVYDFLFCGKEAGLGQCEGTRADPGGNPLQQPYGSGYSGAANGGITYIRKDI